MTSKATRLIARNNAAKAGVALDGNSVEQATADLNTARGREYEAKSTFIKTSAANDVAQERAAAVKRAEDAAKAEAARLAEEAKRAKDAADAAVAEFRAANADYDHLRKKSP